MKEYVHIGNHYGKNVYYLNAEGRDWIGSEREMKWNLRVEHYLMRNDVFIHYGCPKDWWTEREILIEPIGGEKKKIVPDATFLKEGKYHFLEVDRTQSMAANKQKIEEYKNISPLMQAEFGHKPVIIFYTAKESREKKLRELCKIAGIEAVIYSVGDIN